LLAAFLVATYLIETIVVLAHLKNLAKQRLSAKFGTDDYTDDYLSRYRASVL